MLLLVTTMAFAAPTTAQLKTAMDAYDAHAIHGLPSLTEAQRAQLIAGDCVRVLQQNADTAKASSATGMLLTSVPRESLWLATQDLHASVDPDLTEFIVKPLSDDAAWWYGYWDLPRPVRDRQWVVHSYNNHALAAATDGQAWEHVWSLVPDGLDHVRAMLGDGEKKGIDAADVDHAIFTPHNEGSWTMLTVGDQTLLAYQASSVVGGSIPSWMVQKLVMMRLESVLRRVEDKATTWVPGHYTSSHAPVFGGDGARIVLD
mgnify:CR=1 FL=1